MTRRSRTSSPSARARARFAPTIYGLLIGDDKDRTPLFWSYVLGVIMIFGGVVAWSYGIDAEGQSLEDIADPLSKVDDATVAEAAPWRFGGRGPRVAAQHFPPRPPAHGCPCRPKTPTARMPRRGTSSLRTSPGSSVPTTGCRRRSRAETVTATSTDAIEREHSWYYYVRSRSSAADRSDA